MDLAALHKSAGKKVGEAILGIKHDQWEEQSDCPEWSVRVLVNHIVSENLWVSELVEGKTIEEVGTKFDGDVLGKYPLEAFEKSQRAADEAFGKPGALQRIVHLSYGDLPAETYATHRLVDLVIHGWDILKSTGQPDELDPELVEAVVEIVEPHKDEFSGSGYFGTAVDIPEDAPLQTRLLGWLGRER